MTKQINIHGPIILVDDDPDDHELFTAVCKRLGVEQAVLHFSDAHELLSHLKDTGESPFIILCDINMPGMNGIELRAAIDKEDELRRKSIPFIFFSTAATPLQVEQAYELAVRGFFVKGISLQETEERFKLILAYWSECQHPNSVQ